MSHQYTDKLKELVSDWERYATSVGYISSDGTHIIEEIGAEDFMKSLSMTDILKVTKRK